MSSSTQDPSTSHLNNPGLRDPRAVAAPPERPKQVQINCHALLNWSELALCDSQALATLLLVVSLANEHNELTISRAELASLAQCEEHVVDAVVQRLVAQRWISVSPIGRDGFMSDYRVNSQAAWTSRNNDRRRAKFSEPLAKLTGNLASLHVVAERRNLVQVFPAPAAETHRPAATQPRQASSVYAKCSMVVRRVARALSQSPDR